MEENPILEKFGGLMKEEPLSCFDDESLLPNTCVLESVMPFSGYYSELPGSDKPQYLYLMLEETCPLEKVMRSTMRIRAYFNHPFDAVAGMVHIFGQHYPVIRIRNLENFGHLRVLQQHYQNEGLVFRKRIKKFSNEPALICLSKFFYLEPVGELMFLDKSQAHHGYFLIPRYLAWDEFGQITREVKYDTSLLYFDAATAFFYENHNISEMVRIYREQLTIEKLAAIRARYMHVMG